INLRIMDSPQLSLLNETTFKTQLEDLWEKTGIDEWLNNLLAITGMERFPSTWGIVIIMLVFVIIIKILLDIFLKTEVGLAIRATGDNQRLICSFSSNTDWLMILGVGISNGLVALSGALIAQHGGVSDVSMGIGMIIIGLPSVIIGEGLFGSKTIEKPPCCAINSPDNA